MLSHKKHKKSVQLPHRNTIRNHIKHNTRQLAIYRPVESDNLRNIKHIITKRCKKIGCRVTIQPFTKVIRHHRYSFSNIIATNPRASAPYIVLVAHIDAPQIPGIEAAIDSATGIAIIFALLQQILAYEPTYPIMALFVDAEEAIDGTWANDNTLTGSRYFVNHYDLTQIDRVYVFDLLGGSFKNKIGLFANNPDSAADLKKLYTINKKYKHQLFSPPWHIIQKSITDDHVPFIEKGVYAVNLIPYTFPKSHHTLSDTYDNVNWEYVTIFYNVFYDFLLQLWTPSLPA